MDILRDRCEAHSLSLTFMAWERFIGMLGAEAASAKGAMYTIPFLSAYISGVRQGRRRKQESTEQPSERQGQFPNYLESKESSNALSPTFHS